jgi:hypothetical protein
VNAGYRDVEDVLMPNLPTAIFNHFDNDAFLIKRDNIGVFNVNEPRKVSHDNGTFSSYIINTSSNQTEDFFKI